MKSRAELMVDCLRELQDSAANIEASAVVSVDGLIIASSLPTEMDVDRMSAMSAAILSLGDRIATELRRGRLDRVTIEGSNGLIILKSISGDAVLTVLARKHARLGLVMHDMERTIAELKQLL